MQSQAHLPIQHKPSCGRHGVLVLYGYAPGYPGYKPGIRAQAVTVQVC